ncbi:MAG TPA: hypothetical protein VMU30_05940 [Bacteroidota bacterium]|nr:hypothetical protein [Bacteroidota bacterium]
MKMMRWNKYYFKAMCLCALFLFPCIAVSQQDTSEEGMTKNFLELIRTSDIIVDAQVISMESRYLDSSDTRSEIFKPMHTTAIYTLVKFKVFQIIKGIVENNEIIIDQPGGKVGRTGQWPSTSPDHRLNDRAIFCFSKQNSNIGLQEYRRIQIRNGLVRLGQHRVDANEYIGIMKQSITDTTAFRKYYHEFKVADEEYRERKLKWGDDGIMPVGAVDSIHQALIQKKHEEYLKKHPNPVSIDTIKGGVK